MPTGKIRSLASSGEAIEKLADTVAQECIGTVMRQLSRIITRRYDEALRLCGVTTGQFTLLAKIAEKDGISATEIGFDLDIERSTLSRNLKRLKTLRYITADPPVGRVGRGLHLTTEGRDALRRAFPLWKRENDIQYGMLEIQLFEALMSMVDRMRPAG